MYLTTVEQLCMLMTPSYTMHMMIKKLSTKSSNPTSVNSQCNNKLTLNVKKTKLMTFMNDYATKKCTGFKLYMRGSILDEVDSYRYLGTEVDNRLNGEVQYNKPLHNLGLKVRTFGKIRKFLDTKAALTVFKSTILPLIDYNDHFQNLWNVYKVTKNAKLGFKNCLWKFLARAW